ncbi:hypothetical protein UY286_05235 [Paenibacillus polymyxa]|nr:hypothetical protein [Paenibacillus polymyxa]MDY7989801.1 hypothetical protein [Paenibacillus polymyxa]MDY8116840.1 hypothetical protein [Paenibacillus polymyxa]
MADTPKGIRYQAVYEPDTERMIKALEIIRDMPIDNSEQAEDTREGA